MNKGLKISINYISNFKFINIFKKNKVKFLNCKKFILFIFFFNYINNHFNWFKKVTLFFKPKFFSLFTMLRAPYRFKLSRDQLTFSRYYIICSFYFKNFFNYFNFSSYFEIISFINIFKFFFPFFESNICFQQKLKIYFNFSFKPNFLLLDYKL